MKKSRSLMFTSFAIVSLLVLILPASPVSAEVLAKTFKINSISTIEGKKTGSLANMKQADQSGTDNDPSKYVLFSTPSTKYIGNHIFVLPSYISEASVQSLELQVNIKAPSYASQVWTWKAYDWDAKKWVALGNNSTATGGVWSTLNFTLPAPVGRFLNGSHKVKIRFQSSNAKGNAKIDFEFINVEFDYKFSGCGETYNSSYEDDVLNLINEKRNAANVPPLARNVKLDAAARLHSSDMACNNFFSHTNLFGVQFYERILAQDYSYWYAGENIAAGYPNPSAVVTAWMNSSVHRDNILNENYTEIGIGYAYKSVSTYGSYWTTDFASPAP